MQVRRGIRLGPRAPLNTARTEARTEASRLYHSKGLTFREVARVLEVDERTVRRWLAGTARRTGPRGRTDIDDAKIIVMFREGAGPTEIAKATGLSRGAVRKRIDRLRGG